MIVRGVVNEQLEATVPIRVTGPNGFVDLVALVDTGFDSFLILPDAIISSLGLIARWRGIATVADGSKPEFNAYAATVEWGDRQVPVLIYGVGQEILIGMRLIENHRLFVDAKPGGVVIIES